MKLQTKTLVLFAVWAAAVVMIGGIFTSYHQPLRAPNDGVLALASADAGHKWRAIHVLSGSCGCSRRVMRNLSERAKLDGFSEEIVVLDDRLPYLEGVNDLLGQIAAKGIAVKRMASQDIPSNAGLRGVPLLIVASPEGRVVYAGGYGNHGDQDVAVMQKSRSGEIVPALPLLGCVVGKRLRQKADPFYLKYGFGN